MDWILWIIPPFPIKHQKDEDDDDDDDDYYYYYYDSLEVWSNVRVGGNILGSNHPNWSDSYFHTQQNYDAA